MPEVRPIPFIEKILVAGLKDDSTLGGLVGNKVSTALPKTFTAEARVQLFRVGGTPVDGLTESIDRPLVQFNAFGSSQEQAFQVAAALVAAIQRLPTQSFSDAVITHTERLSGPYWSPDPDRDIPRYILTAAVIAHSR